MSCADHEFLVMLYSFLWALWSLASASWVGFTGIGTVHLSLSLESELYYGVQYFDLNMLPALLHHQRKRLSLKLWCFPTFKIRIVCHNWTEWRRRYGMECTSLGGRFLELVLLYSRRRDYPNPWTETAFLIERFWCLCLTKLDIQSIVWMGKLGSKVDGERQRCSCWMAERAWGFPVQ